MDKVEWYGMSYKEICAKNMLEKVNDWITYELKPDSKHEDYIKYLTNFCGFPQTFTGIANL